jgi:hypothetical protein
VSHKIGDALGVLIKCYQFENIPALPILSPSGIDPPFRVQLLGLESSFVTLDNVSDVIDLFWKETGQFNASQTAVCLAALSINPSRTSLKAQKSNNANLVYC